MEDCREAGLFEMDAWAEAEEIKGPFLFWFYLLGLQN